MSKETSSQDILTFLLYELGEENATPTEDEGIFELNPEGAIGLLQLPDEEYRNLATRLIACLVEAAPHFIKAGIEEQMLKGKRSWQALENIIFRGCEVDGRPGRLLVNKNKDGETFLDLAKVWYLIDIDEVLRKVLKISTANERALDWEGDFEEIDELVEAAKTKKTPMEKRAELVNRLQNIQRRFEKSKQRILGQIKKELDKARQ